MARPSRKVTSTPTLTDGVVVLDGAASGAGAGSILRGARLSDDAGELLHAHDQSHERAIYASADRIQAARAHTGRRPRDELRRGGRHQTRLEVLGRRALQVISGGHGVPGSLGRARHGRRNGRDDDASHVILVGGVDD